MKTQLEFERKEAERIKDLNLQKSIMYTNITHEFRTPLTIILGMTEHILNHPRSSNIHGIDMIKRNVKNLLNLVNDILDLSKLESGKLELKLRTGDIISYLKYLIEPFQWMAKSQNKGLYLIINIESLVIEYDSEKIAQIFNNLISNAIKFTPENNSVFIQIDEFHDHINNFLIINIRDSGAGISKVHLEQIFERYYNNSESETSFKGSGIGLALTKELINLINGEIIVNSPAKGFKIGSEFIVKIPINKIDSPSLPKVVEPEVLEDYPNLEGENFIPEENDSEKDLILLIEDNIDIIEYLSISLKKFNLVVAKDGQEGFVVAKEMIPNLIITDILMPNIDGLEMCKMIKNDPNTNHIPIIVITAKVGKQINFEALQNGADVYLEKPFQPEPGLHHFRRGFPAQQNPGPGVPGPRDEKRLAAVHFRFLQHQGHQPIHRGGDF